MTEAVERLAQEKLARERLAQRVHFETIARLRTEDRLRHGMRIVSLLLLAGIIIVSLLPYEFRAQTLDQAITRFLHATPIDPYYWYSDQWTGHAIAYGTLAFCIMGANLRRGGMLPAVWVAAFAFAVAMGFTCLLEFGQTYLPARNVSGNDISAGACGALTGIIAWFVVGPSLLDLGARIERGGAAALGAGGALYVIVYALLMLFPFDIIFSLSGLRDMAAAGKPFLGADNGDAGLIRTTVRMGLEIAMAAPLGLLLLRRGFGTMMVMAVLIGVGVEVIQFALVTGQSTALGALTRTLGIILGWFAARRLLALDHLPALSGNQRSLLRVGAALAVVPYAMLIVLLDRWHAGTRPSPDEAMAILRGVAWVPFYYMYSGDEVTAAVSALSQIAVYLPLGILIWFLYGHGGQRPLWTAALIALLFSALVEAGGLFVAGYRPDPTNLLLSVMGALGGVWLAGGVRYWLGRVFAGGVAEHDLSHPARIAPRSPLAFAVALVLWGAALLILFDYPAANGWLLAGAVAYGLLLRRHPHAWMVIIPAALPVLDFMTLTGRIMVDPFDALILVTVAMELVRQPLQIRDFGWRGAFLWLMLAYVVAYAIAVLNGWLPLPPMDANAFTAPYSSWQVMWAAKGFVAALALAPFLWRAVRDEPAALLLVGYGMAGGLLLCGLVVLWERFLFTGILNFNTEYRAVGAFSTMRTGGAHLDAYLATTLPFAALIALMHRNLKGAVGAVLLALIGLYGAYVTFSRGPYLAVLAAAIMLGLGLWVASRKNDGRLVRFAAFAVIGAGIAVAAAVPFLNGSFLAKRFETTAEDSGIRWTHWNRVLDMRDGDLVSRLFGMGPGRFPAVYFAKNDDKTPMGSILLGTDNGHGFARLTSGQSVYLSQFVRVKPNRTYTLSYRVRATGKDPVLATPICEKWVTDSFTCNWQSVSIGDTGGAWKTESLTVTSGDLAAPLGRLGWITSRPVKFTLYNASHGAVIDVTDLKLLTDQGRNLIDNPDFSAGLDSWYMTVDDHLPWHIKNVFVAALFDQGYVGLLLFVGLVVLVSLRLLMQVMDCDRYSAVLLAAFTGFFVVGIIDSPFDTPRLALLFYLLLFSAYYLGEVLRRSSTSVADDGA